MEQEQNYKLISWFNRRESSARVKKKKKTTSLPGPGKNQGKKDAEKKEGEKNGLEGGPYKKKNHCGVNAFQTDWGEKRGP